MSEDDVSKYDNPYLFFGGIHLTNFKVLSIRKLAKKNIYVTINYGKEQFVTKTYEKQDPSIVEYFEM
jgi:hypothetical protein